MVLREFAQRLKEERERLGLAQREIADALGVDKSSVYGYERGDRSPPGQHLTTLASLGADVLYIVTGTRITEASDAVLLNRVIDAVVELEASLVWRKLDKEEKKDLLVRFLNNRVALPKDENRDTA